MLVGVGPGTPSPRHVGGVAVEAEEKVVIVVQVEVWFLATPPEWRPVQLGPVRGVDIDSSDIPVSGWT